MKAMASTLTLFRRTALTFSTAVLSLASFAQQPTVPTVPNLMTFSGTVRVEGLASSVAGVTFALYREQDGGAPLWVETQNVSVDAKGHYTVQLGTTKPNGVPFDLFTSGEARWLGVRPQGSPEQPRVLLVSVPYALKAADADTIGGRPASAFVLAPSPGAASTSSDSAVPPPASVTGGGTLNFLPLWTSTSTLGSSVLFQSGTGVTAKIGIGTATPTSFLDVKGSTAIRGVLNLPATGVASTSAGKNSQPETFTTSSFNSGTSTAVNQTFRWQAEPAGNNTATASGTLNLLFAQGSTTPAETGLKLASNGRITFAPGQTFPGTGTVKSIALTAPASEFNVTGSPVTGSGALGLNWNVAPTDANTASAMVKRDSTGSFNANNINLTGTLSTSTGNPFAILASSSYATGAAIEANATSTTGPAYAVYATTASGDFNAIAIYGVASKSLNAASTVGVEGASASVSGVGVLGRGGSSTATFNANFGVVRAGAWGDGSDVGLMATGDDNYATIGINSSQVSPTALFINGADNVGLTFQAEGSSGQNCRIDVLGDLACTGTITANAGTARIDHPLDPANKYLSHAAVESSEALHLYTGNVRLDARGEATVQMPSWFDAVNADFRYQLTAVGTPGAGLYVAEKIKNNRFRIAGGAPNAEVSWQVTCVRNDPYSKAHPLIVEQVKPTAELGYYEHPELYGQPIEKGIFSRQRKLKPGDRKTASAKP